MHRNGNFHEWIKLRIGRRKADPLLSVDFHAKRMCIEWATSWIVGVYLEEIEPGQKNECRGMVIMKTGWSKHYFLRKRKEPTWTEDDYFKLADRLFWEKGIKHP